MKKNHYDDCLKRRINAKNDLTPLRLVAKYNIRYLITISQDVIWIRNDECQKRTGDCA